NSESDKNNGCNIEKVKPILLKSNIVSWIMESAKKSFTDEEIDLLAKKFKILSEPSRLKILRTLFQGEKCVTEIINSTGLLQANVSKQLRILEKEGILASRAAGLQRFYKLEDENILQICNAICANG
ncbi:MAG: ArsR/SmtB family transcription factor, partial [Bacteroidota bacterium]